MTHPRNRSVTIELSAEEARLVARELDALLWMIGDDDALADERGLAAAIIGKIGTD